MIEVKIDKNQDVIKTKEIVCDIIITPDYIINNNGVKPPKAYRDVMLEYIGMDGKIYKNTCLYCSYHDCYIVKNENSEDVDKPIKWEYL